MQGIYFGYGTGNAGNNTVKGGLGLRINENYELSCGGRSIVGDAYQDLKYTYTWKGQWIFVACMLDVGNKKIRLLVNGTEVSNMTATFTSPTGTVQATTNPSANTMNDYIGGYPAGSATPGSPVYFFNGAIDWHGVINVVADNAVAGLPDASKGDVVWFYQARHQSIGSGPAAAVYRPATKAARLSNLTLRDGLPATIDVPLAPVPQTGSMTADVRYTWFAALAADVNPSARSNQFSFNVFAMPHGAGYPDMPFDSMVVRPLLLAYDFTTGSASLPDTNYGTVAYGQFSDQPLWQEFRQTLYFYEVTISPPGAASFTWTAFVTAHEAMSSAPIAPALGPVKAPQVNGRSLFQPQSGVGLQPTISWSPPAVGAATSVLVGITPLNGGTTLQATVRSGTSFTVPPGLLVAGQTYVVTLTAQQAPWDGADAPPLRSGVPSYTADCITSTFTA